MSNLEANRLELRGDLSGLRRLAGWIEAGAQHELSADTSFAVQLCLEEAVANIIMHGGAKDGGAPDFVEVGEAGIAVDDAMRRQRRVQLVG
jgi:anti-sigma regulatory factor (Ser/Thr protein kinase)